MASKATIFFWTYVARPGISPGILATVNDCTMSGPDIKIRVLFVRYDEFLNITMRRITRTLCLEVSPADVRATAALSCPITFPTQTAPSFAPCFAPRSAPFLFGATSSQAQSSAHAGS